MEGLVGKPACHLFQDTGKKTLLFSRWYTPKRHRRSRALYLALICYPSCPSLASGYPVPVCPISWAVKSPNTGPGRLAEIYRETAHPLGKTRVPVHEQLLHSINCCDPSKDTVLTTVRIIETSRRGKLKKTEGENYRTPITRDGQYYERCRAWPKSRFSENSQSGVPHKVCSSCGANQICSTVPPSLSCCSPGESASEYPPILTPPRAHNVTSMKTPTSIIRRLFSGLEGDGMGGGSSCCVP